MAAQPIAKRPEADETEDGPAFSQFEVADYVADMANELAALSNRAGLDVLGTLLNNVNTEASRILRAMK